MKNKNEYSRLYILQGSTIIDYASISTFSLSDIEFTQLWHMHFKHMSEIGMAELSKK